jgi:hypothetical protein
MSKRLNLKAVKVFPLVQRASMARVEEILIDPDLPPPPASDLVLPRIQACAAHMKSARARGSCSMLIYGAHLVKNGASSLVNRLIEQGWINHLATNGAGVIHDWEFAFQAKSTESVEKNVATGTFGTWDETGRNIHLALMVGALSGKGFGESIGELIENDGLSIPSTEELRYLIVTDPAHSMTPARSELLNALRDHQIRVGKIPIAHRWKYSSIFRTAYKFDVPITVHPGIGYDIFSNHPYFNGAVIGRAGGWDFEVFGHSVENLDGGVVLSVGSAIMGPQVFEKSLSCVNNLRLQEKRRVVHDHNIYVVDLQDGGNWDWTQGEPPKENPAYYLRFCKSFSRMGGSMQYVQSDNVVFLHNLLSILNQK